MRSPLCEHHRFDEAVLAAQLHLHDLAFGPDYAALLRVVAQITRIQRRIEVKCVGDRSRAAIAGFTRPHEPAVAGAATACRE